MRMLYFTCDSKDAFIIVIICRKPWRSKRRMLRRMRMMTQSKVNNRIELNQKLNEYLKGRDYIYYYRGFDRWQQAFQAHKMEEHLCAQNLAYYYYQRRSKILHGWSLLTIMKIYNRIKDIKSKKEMLQVWHRSGVVSKEGRKTRVLTRALDRWRGAYKVSVAIHYINDTNKKTRRLIFVSWQMSTRRQRDSHARSIEFIGTSNLRYYLQKWRMEAAIHRYRGQRKGLVRRSGLNDVGDRTKPRRPTLTLSREQMRDFAPLTETEFMV